MDTYCQAETAAQLAWSARGIHRSLHIAHSITDLAQSETITPAHLAEVVHYRQALLGNTCL
ncbi:MAG: hypothetical protein ACN6O1_01145 [Comamonas sp.]|uniref:magnesium chelatase subunit ChlI family protein n=1 Tax=Comamonas sp. TaxID=34028 RepID=UPI003D0F96D7